MALELSAKRVEVLKELIPRASKIALLSNPEHAFELAEYRVTEDAARRLGATMTRYLARSPQELSTVFAEIHAARPEAMMFVFPDSLTLARRQEIADFAAKELHPGLTAGRSSPTRAGSCELRARARGELQNLGEVRRQARQRRRCQHDSDRAGQPHRVDTQHAGGGKLSGCRCRQPSSPASIA